MNRLRYGFKFALIGMLFLLPLSVVMYYFQREINTNIEFNQNELRGTIYLRPVSTLLGDLVQYEGALGGNKPSAITVKLHAKLEQDFAAISAVEDRLGGSLRTKAE